MFDELDAATQQTPEVQAQEAPQEQPKEQPKPKESAKDENMRLIREQLEAERRRNLELERIVRENMSQNQPSTKMQLADDDDIGVDDDLYIDGKQFKKYVKGLKQELKESKKQFEQYQQQSSLENAERSLRAQFADFDSVVNEENLKKFATQEPVLFRSIMANQNIGDRGYSAYKMIKNSGVLTNEYAAVDKKLEENKSKPRSAANASPQTAETPLMRVGDYDRRVLTEERKEQLRRQVEEAKRNR
jgi:hypothetical protein